MSSSSRIYVYSVPGARTSPRWCKAFVRGCGGEFVEDTGTRPGPIALFGAPELWNVLQEAREQGRTWYYGDHGYFRKGTYYRITRNAFQHDGRGQAGPERFQQLGLEVKPWRANGGHILVCPPGQITGVLYGFSADLWREAVLARLRALTDRPIRVRPKPHHCAPASRPLEEDLKDCWALVTWRSNTAVEALLAGVPVFPLGRCAASRMGREDLELIENPAYPEDREQFFWNLAANQWTLDEIADGTAWRALN